MKEIIGALLLVGLGGYFFYALYKDNKKKKEDGQSSKKKKKKHAETVQELLDYESISDKGIVKLKNGTFTATIEVSQINQRLNNNAENTAVWRKFRSMINAIGIRETLLVQSQYLDIMDFVHEYDETAKNVPNLTPQLLAAKDDVVNSYKQFAEQKTREYRSYIIFRFNPYMDNREKGLQTGNATIDNLLSSAKGKTNQMTDEEAEDLANSILDEVVDLAYQLLHGIGIRAVRLNRAGVLRMTYTTLNRDLALSQRIEDASNAHSFSEFKQSLTPFIVEEETRIAETIIMNGNELDTFYNYEDSEKIQEETKFTLTR